MGLPKDLRLVENHPKGCALVDHADQGVKREKQAHGSGQNSAGQLITNRYFQFSFGTALAVSNCLRKVESK